MHWLGCSSHSFDRVGEANYVHGICLVMPEAHSNTQERVSKSGRCYWENTYFSPRLHFWATRLVDAGETWFQNSIVVFEGRTAISTNINKNTSENDFFWFFFFCWFLFVFLFDFFLVFFFSLKQEFDEFPLKRNVVDVVCCLLWCNRSWGREWNSIFWKRDGEHYLKIVVKN